MLVFPLGLEVWPEEKRLYDMVRRDEYLTWENAFVPNQLCMPGINEVPDNPPENAFDGTTGSSHADCRCNRHSETRIYARI